MLVSVEISDATGMNRIHNELRSIILIFHVSWDQLSLLIWTDNMNVPHVYACACITITYSLNAEFCSSTPPNTTQEFCQNTRLTLPILLLFQRIPPLLFHNIEIRLQIFWKKCILPSLTYKMLQCNTSRLSLLHPFPNIHKEGHPFRPSVSLWDSYLATTFLAYAITFFSKSQTHWTSSTFITSTKHCRISIPLSCIFQRWDPLLSMKYSTVICL